MQGDPSAALIRLLAGQSPVPPGGWPRRRRQGRAGAADPGSVAWCSGNVVQPSAMPRQAAAMARYPQGAAL